MIGDAVRVGPGAVRQHDAARTRGVARDVRDAGRNASPEYGQALDRQSQLRRAVLDPAEAGPLGKMAGTPDLQQQGAALLPANPVAGSEKVVTQSSSLFNCSLGISK